MYTKHKKEKSRMRWKTKIEKERPRLTFYCIYEIKSAMIALNAH